MNLFNALTGKEARQAILNEVARALESDSEFREHLTFPRVSWKWRLEMDIYPRTPTEKIVEASGDEIQMQTEQTDGGTIRLSRDANGNLMPVTAESETHIKQILSSAPKEVVAPDAVREAEGLVQNQAQPGGVRIARRVEVGTAARNPTVTPGLNR